MASKATRARKRLRYDELRCDRILETIGRLELRISERFPSSGLSHVSAQLGRLASEAGARVERLRRPIWLLRIGAGLGILGIVGITLGLAMLGMSRPLGVQGLADLLQASEAAINEIILLAIAIFFLLSLETRVKRGGAEGAAPVAQHRSHRGHASADEGSGIFLFAIDGNGLLPRARPHAVRADALS